MSMNFSKKEMNPFFSHVSKKLLSAMFAILYEQRTLIISFPPWNAGQLTYSVLTNSSHTVHTLTSPKIIQ